MLEILIFATHARGRLFIGLVYSLFDLADMMITHIYLCFCIGLFLRFGLFLIFFFFLFFSIIDISPFPYFLLSFLPFVFSLLPQQSFCS